MTTKGTMEADPTTAAGSIVNALPIDGTGETFIEVPWKPVRAVATGSITWTTSVLVPSRQQLLIPLASYSPQQPNPCP